MSKTYTLWFLIFPYDVADLFGITCDVGADWRREP